MLNGHSNGFIKKRVIIIIVALVLLVGFSVCWLISYSQEENAKSFGNSFIASINDKDVVSGYDALSSTLKDSLGSIYSWAIWSSEFPKNNLAISDSPKTVKSNGINLIEPDYLITYGISNGSNIQIRLIYKNNKWNINDYVVLD